MFWRITGQTEKTTLYEQSTSQLNDSIVVGSDNQGNFIHGLLENLPVAYFFMLEKGSIFEQENLHLV